MGCCGNWWSGPTHTMASGQHRPGPTVLFEYQGAGQLTLYGRVTGMRYHFTGPGSRVPVDARDAPVLEVISGLAMVTG